MLTVALEQRMGRAEGLLEGLGLSGRLSQRAEGEAMRPVATAETGPSDPA